jgi:hypothetical protein
MIKWLRRLLFGELVPVEDEPMPDEAVVQTATPATPSPATIVSTPYLDLYGAAVWQAEEFRVRLNDVDNHQKALRWYSEGDTVVIDEVNGNPAGKSARTTTGEVIGVMPRRGAFIDAIKSGKGMLGAEIAKISENDFGETARVTLVVKVVAGATAAEIRTAKLVATADQVKPEVYHVGLVGERNYQAVIAQCAVGQTAQLFREPGNPYDDLAIAVTGPGGATIGYVGRDNWLRTAINEEGKGCRASISGVGVGEGGLLGVVIDVELCEGPLSERPFELA